MAYLIGGLAVLGFLAVLVPLVVIRGMAAFAEILSQAEVKDDD